LKTHLGGKIEFKISSVWVVSLSMEGFLPAFLPSFPCDTPTKIGI
jgi:hypothetical protein